MEIIKEEKNYYLVETEGQKFLAEKLFIDRKPRSQIIWGVIKELDQIIARSKNFKHPNYIKYHSVEQVAGEYCLLRESSPKLIPLIRYLKQEKVDLNKIVEWILVLNSLGREAEEKGFNWPGFNLASLYLDEKKNIYLLDPGIHKLLAQYRDDLEDIMPGEMYQAPEVFKKQEWQEKDRVYSLGIVFYYLVTGERPFKAEEKADLIDEIINTTPVEPKYYNYKLSGELNDLIMALVRGKVAKWTFVDNRLTQIKASGKISASPAEEKENREKGQKAIKSSHRKKGIRFFWRKQGLVLIGVLVAIAFALIIWNMGGTPPTITEDTPPLKVVEYFYQAINEKNVPLLGETNILDLKRLEDMVSEAYVLEKMRSAYSLEQEEVKSLFGIKGLKITQVADEVQPVFKAEYEFFITTEDQQVQQAQMEDIIKLGNVDGVWRIVELEGSIEYLINGESSKILQ